MTPATTTATIIASLDAIISELVRIENVLVDVPAGTVQPEDASRLRRSAVRMREEAQMLIDWLSESRLEEPRN